MSGKVIELDAKRPPVAYIVRLLQGYCGELTVSVEGVADDSRSRRAVAHALKTAAKLIKHNRKLKK